MNDILQVIGIIIVSGVFLWSALVVDTWIKQNRQKEAGRTVLIPNPDLSYSIADSTNTKMFFEVNGDTTYVIIKTWK